MAGGFVEELQALIAGAVPFDEFGVEGLEVGQDEELEGGGVVAHVAFLFGVGAFPFAGGLAEEGDVEQVGLGGLADGFAFGVPIDDGH